MTFRLREKVDAVEALHGRGARLQLASGKEIVSETVLYATGRQGDTDELGLADGRPGGRQARPDRGRRELPHRGRRTSSPWATARAAPGWRRPRWSRAGSRRCTRSTSRSSQLPELIPTGVYAIPELAMVGRTEEAADRRGRALRVRDRALERARPRRDHRRPRRACSSCSSPPRTGRSSACTCSARAPPTSSTSARP